MLFVSDFADQAVMLPLALLVTSGLVMLGWGRGATAWACAVGGTFGLILVLKSGFIALAAAFGSGYEMSPSGHVGAACVVYGGLAFLLFPASTPRLLVAIVPASAVLVIGYTRLSLEMHSLAEVVAGAAIGGAGLAAMTMTAGPRPSITTWPLSVAVACVVLGLHGFHLPAEEAIRIASSNW